MGMKQRALASIKRTKTGARLIADSQYRRIAKAVISLTGNLLFAFYNGILGALTSSVIFMASSVYYLLLSIMRFSAVMNHRRADVGSDRRAASMIGILLILLSILFHTMVIISMKYQTAAFYNTISMITIATFTFAKITIAVISAVRHRQDGSLLFTAINRIRYSEVAVSLLTMQQSMLVSFGDANDGSSVLLNACTGAGVCIFIFTLGIITFKKSRKETGNGKD